MMGLFTLISLVLVVQFVGAETVFKEVEYGKFVYLWASGYTDKILWANAIHNNIIYNILKLTDDHMVHDRTGRFSKFYLRSVTFDHAGEWKINSSVLTKNVKKEYLDTVHLRVIKSDQKLLPTNPLIGEEGSHVTIYFENYFDNITSCKLTSSDGSIKSELSDSNNEIVKGLEIYEKCRVRMHLNSAWPNKWILSQENEKGNVMSGTLRIYYVSKSTLPERRSETWNIGSDQTVINMNSDIQFCEIEQPNGQVISLHSYKCTYTVKQVNNNHAGTWRVRYLPTYSMDVVNQEIIVTVIDTQNVSCSVTEEENGVIHLQCQTFLKEIDYCLFTTPSGNMINVVTGIGIAKYEYYGTTHQTVGGKDYSQCGLTIRNPSDDDRGLWKCTIQSSDSSSSTINTFIPTNGHEKKEVERLHITTHKVSAKLGDDFTIKCTTETSLEYCSLQSPNGTIYSVTKNRGNVLNHLPYTGEGLSVGVCGAYIEEAHKTDDGDWICRLGVSSEDSEIESTVSVTVTEGYVVPQKKTINVATNKEIKLLVNVLPNKELTIKYCRWVHPNVRRFYEGNASKYSRKQNDTSCSVSLKEVHQEDLGTWGCYVAFNTGFDEEFYTTIELVNERQSGILTAVNVSVIILLTITIICGIISGFSICKKRSEIQLQTSQTSTLTGNEFKLAYSYPITVQENVG